MRYTKDFKWFSIDFVEQWSEWFRPKRYNWQEFEFILLRARFEKENVHGVAELEFYLLGLGIRFYWVWNKEMMDKKAEEYGKLLSNPDNWVEAK